MHHTFFRSTATSFHTAVGYFFLTAPLSVPPAENTDENPTSTVGRNTICADAILSEDILLHSIHATTAPEQTLSFLDSDRENTLPKSGAGSKLFARLGRSDFCVHPALYQRTCLSRYALLTSSTHDNTDKCFTQNLFKPVCTNFSFTSFLSCCRNYAFYRRVHYIE